MSFFGWATTGPHPIQQPRFTVHDGHDGFEILGEGVLKEWSHENRCYIYRVSNNDKKNSQKSLKSLIAHYYKLK